jgi:DNA-binding CsgD family transcriptional regulator
MAEAITILAAWVLLGVNTNEWLRDRSMQAVGISQASAAQGDWSRMGEVPRGHDSVLFENYRKTLTALSSKFFPQNDGDVYLVYIIDGKEYRIDPYDVVPFDYVGAPSRWEVAAYASRRTTYNLVPYSDNFGTYLGAYTPIVADNKVIGLVAAEYDSATFDEFQGLVRKAFWYSVIPAIVLSLLVAYALAARFVDPMEVFRRIDETTRGTTGRDGAGPLDTLSLREREVAELVRQGLTNRQIAERLVVTPETVKQHLKNIKEKTGFNKVDLAVHAEAVRQQPTTT